MKYLLIPELGRLYLPKTDLKRALESVKKVI